MVVDEYTLANLRNLILEFKLDAKFPFNEDRMNQSNLLDVLYMFTHMHLEFESVVLMFCEYTHIVSTLLQVMVMLI